MWAQDMPNPSTSPRIVNTIQASVERLAISSQPWLTIHQTIAANSPISSASPTVPTACSVERMKKIHRPSSTMPAIASAGVTEGKPSASQW
jgi:hypothetical protein